MYSFVYWDTSLHWTRRSSYHVPLTRWSKEFCSWNGTRSYRSCKYIYITTYILRPQMTWFDWPIMIIIASIYVKLQFINVITEWCRSIDAGVGRDEVCTLHTIIIQDPLAELTEEDKENIWKMRYVCMCICDLLLTLYS